MSVYTSDKKEPKIGDIVFTLDCRGGGLGLCKLIKKTTPSAFLAEFLAGGGRTEIKRKSITAVDCQFCYDWIEDFYNCELMPAWDGSPSRLSVGMVVFYKCLNRIALVEDATRGNDEDGGCIFVRPTSRSKMHVVHKYKFNDLPADLSSKDYADNLKQRVSEAASKNRGELISLADSLMGELDMAIDEINTMRDIHHKDQLTPADHWGKEGLHDAQVKLHEPVLVTQRFP